MASLKVYFICALLVLGVAVHGQKDKKKKDDAAAKPAAGGANTRGNFGGFNQGGFNQGGFNQAGVHGGGAYRPPVGNVGLGNFNNQHRPGGFNQHRPIGQGGFNQNRPIGQGGFNQNRPIGQGGFNQNRPIGVGGGFGQGGYQPGVGVGGLGSLGGGYQPGVGVGGVGGGYQPGVGVGGLGGTGSLAGIHAGLGGAGVAKPAKCRYWCRTPDGAAYCCENANQSPKPDIATQIVKAGQCPPVRVECPLRAFSGPPEKCSKHGDCNGVDRCCFDKCLREHVCKPPHGYGK